MDSLIGLKFKEFGTYNNLESLIISGISSYHDHDEISRFDAIFSLIENPKIRKIIEGKINNYDLFKIEAAVISEVANEMDNKVNVK